MANIINIGQRVNTLDYNYFDVSVSKSFDEVIPYVAAMNQAEAEFDELLLNRLKDHLSMNYNDDRKRMYFQAMVDFYSMPREQRRLTK